MQTRRIATLLVLVMVLVSIVGCGGEKNRTEAPPPTDSRETTEPLLPAVTLLQAEQAMTDAMLASAISLFLAFRAEPGSMSTGSEDGTITLSWDESADFSTGVGVYTTTLTGFALAPDDPFAADYNGYVLDGTVIMGSTDGVSTRIEMNLATRHEDSAGYPVQTIELSLEDAQPSDSGGPVGQILINGHEMQFEDLAQALDLGR